MQDECQPLGGRQRVQDDQERGPDRVGKQRFGLGVDAVRVADDRLGQAHPDWLFTA